MASSRKGGGCCAIVQAQRRVELGQMDNEISYNEALIDERDAGIAEISQQIGEVNEIFQARPGTLDFGQG